MTTVILADKNLPQLTDVRHECHSNNLLLKDSCNILNSAFSNLAFILQATT